ncbi:MAG: S1C family serine protease [Planctomycetota bacterium]
MKVNNQTLFCGKLKQLLILILCFVIQDCFSGEENELIKDLLKKYIFIGGGSGVIISSDGYALTNAHVVGEARKIIVRFVGGKTAYADLINIDPLADIALIKIKNVKEHPFAKFADPKKVNVGNPVIAIGNPFILGIEDFTPTVTRGIITAKHIYLSDILQSQRIRFVHIDMLQTDASINPGNSGGPLFNLKGELVGINSSLRSRWAFELEDREAQTYRYNTGTGYAISIAYIKKLLPKLYSQEIITHCYIAGLQFDNPGYRSQLFFDKGLVVSPLTRREFLPQGFNVEPGDVILKVNGKIVNNIRTFYHYVLETLASEKLSITVKKKGTGKIKTYKFNCQPYPITINLESKLFFKDMNTAFLGVELEDIEDLVGVKVSGVVDNSPASNNLKVGDIIIEFNEKQILSKLDFQRYFQFTRPGEIVKLKVKRNDEILQFKIKLTGRKSY